MSAKVRDRVYSEESESSIESDTSFKTADSLEEENDEKQSNVRSKPEHDFISKNSSSSCHLDPLFQSKKVNSLEYDESQRTNAHPAIDPSDKLDEKEISSYEPEKNLELALEAKELGNSHFREKRYDDAIEAYTLAIDHCPPDKVEELATFYGNRAAAYFNIKEYAVCVEDCTVALESNASYVKVLSRRSQAYELLDKPDEALADLKAIRDIDPSYTRINQNIARLEKVAADKLEALKNEAFGKLKELGNTILGNFGMSINDFKASQDPKTGSWSIGMNR